MGLTPAICWVMSKPEGGGGGGMLKPCCPLWGGGGGGTGGGAVCCCCCCCCCQGGGGATPTEVCCHGAVVVCGGCTCGGGTMLTLPPATTRSQSCFTLFVSHPPSNRYPSGKEPALLGLHIAHTRGYSTHHHLKQCHNTLLKGCGHMLN